MEKFNKERQINIVSSKFTQLPQNLPEYKRFQWIQIWFWTFHFEDFNFWQMSIFFGNLKELVLCDHLFEKRMFSVSNRKTSGLSNELLFVRIWLWEEFFKKQNMFCTFFSEKMCNKECTVTTDFKCEDI